MQNLGAASHIAVENADRNPAGSNQDGRLVADSSLRAGSHL